MSCAKGTWNMSCSALNAENIDRSHDDVCSPFSWGAGGVLSEYVLLPHQGLQCVRPMGIGKSFVWSVRKCQESIRKVSTIAFSSRMTSLDDYSHTNDLSLRPFDTETAHLIS